jgi:hypothetical protein
MAWWLVSPATYRCASAGRITRVQAINIKGQVYRVICEVLACLFDDGFYTNLVYTRRIDDIETHRIGVLGTQANLN